MVFSDEYAADLEKRLKALPPGMKEREVWDSIVHDEVRNAFRDVLGKARGEKPVRVKDRDKKHDDEAAQ